MGADDLIKNATKPRTLGYVRCDSEDCEHVCMVCRAPSEDGWVLVHWEGAPREQIRAVCFECVSCMVTAGMQGPVSRSMDVDALTERLQ